MTKKAVDMIETYSRATTKDLEKTLAKWRVRMTDREMKDLREIYVEAIKCVTAILVTRKHNVVRLTRGEGPEAWVCRRCGHHSEDPTRLLDWLCEVRKAV